MVKLPKGLKLLKYVNPAARAALYAKLIIAGILLVVTAVVLMVAVVSYGDVSRTVTSTRSNGKTTASQNVDTDLDSKYPKEDKSGKPVEYKDGLPGNGVNLLLINNIKTNSYVKELLELYADSANGKLDDYAQRMPVTGLLGMHFNEFRTYPDGIILKSLLPYDSKSNSPVWNKAYQGIPAAAMTLRQFNSYFMNSPNGYSAGNAGVNKLSYPANNATYLNIFQVNGSYFNNLSPAKINGYSTKSGRKADGIYLPDSLAYINREYSSMLSTYGLDPKSDARMLVGAYSYYHNAGPNALERAGIYGVTDFDYLIGRSKRLGENAKYGIGISSDIITAAKAHPKFIKKEQPAARGALLLLEQGYYLTPTAFNNMVYGSSGYPINKDTLIAWQDLYGEKITQEQLAEKLKPKLKTLTDAYGSYATASQYQSVYGRDNNVNTSDRGNLFKLTTDTSPAYKGKISGKDPRVLHVINLETVGHNFNATVGGDVIYGELLKYAGVDVDPTNPADYAEKLEGDYVPPSSDFAAVMKKIGADTSNKLAFSMLKYAYDRSGFWYFWGGTGFTVKQSNYGTARGVVNYTQVLNTAFATKNGAAPSASQPDSNLLNLGQYLYDCSGLIKDAYDNVVKPAYGGASLERNSNGQRTSSLLTNVSSPKFGDIYAKNGHVFFFVTTYKGSNITLTSSESKVTDKVIKASTGISFVLEAPSSYKKVGLRIYGPRNFGGFTLRRFKAFQ